MLGQSQHSAKSNGYRFTAPELEYGRKSVSQYGTKGYPQYSSLGQPYRVPVGPNQDVAAFRATLITTWRLVGTVDDVPVDLAVPVCETEYIWVRQVQSILAPERWYELPDWFWFP